MTLTQISTAGVKDDAVTSGKIPANAVGESELADNAVDTAAIADDAVTQDKIAPNAIQGAIIANNAITEAKIATGAVTTAKLGAGAVGTARIADGAVATAKIADQAVTLAKLPHGTSSNDGKFLRANNGADPTFETVSTDLVNDTSPQLGGDLQTNGNHIGFADSNKARFGNGNDLDIYHDGSNSYVTHENGSGHLYLQGDAIRLRTRSTTGNEDYIVCSESGAVSAYYNNSKKFETTSTGIQTVEAVKMTYGGTGVNLKVVHEAGVGNTASTTATIPTSCVGGGTVTVTVMHNGNTSITTTKMYPIMFQGNTTPNLGSEIFSINANSAASFSVSAATLGVTVTNNAGAHAKVRVTFDITANA